jgi:hypothetical protein
MEHMEVFADYVIVWSGQFKVVEIREGQGLCRCLRRKTLQNDSCPCIRLKNWAYG